MSFWTGAFLGFAVGAAFAVIVLLGWFRLVAKWSTDEKSNLHKFWEQSLKNQQRQIDVLSDIAEVIEVHK